MTEFVPCKIFVGGCRPETRAPSIYHYFSQYGTVVNVDIVLGHKDQPRGFCFVVFDEDSAVERCLSSGRVQVLEWGDSRVLHAVDGKWCEVKRAVSQIPQRAHKAKRKLERRRREVEDQLREYYTAVAQAQASGLVDAGSMMAQPFHPGFAQNLAGMAAPGYPPAVPGAGFSPFMPPQHFLAPPAPAGMPFAPGLLGPAVGGTVGGALPPSAPPGLPTSLLAGGAAAASPFFPTPPPTGTPAKAFGASVPPAGGNSAVNAAPPSPSAATKTATTPPPSEPSSAVGGDDALTSSLLALTEDGGKEEAGTNKDAPLFAEPPALSSALPPTFKPPSAF